MERYIVRKIISKNHLIGKLINFSVPMAILASGLLASGCSVSFPMAGLIDAGPTASIKPRAAAPLMLASSNFTDPAQPLAASGVDMMPTGSIASSSIKMLPAQKLLSSKSSALLRANGSGGGVAAMALSPLAAHLQASDLVSARSALNLALDPASTPQSVAWSNPMTGASGAFVAKGNILKTVDSNCRNFQAVVRATPDAAVQKLSGNACADEYGQWIVKSLDETPSTT